jgi:hypothetical protein
MVILPLNGAIVMTFLPFSAEFTIPGWAKFGGSAAILLGCMYLTFDLASRGTGKRERGTTSSSPSSGRGK